MIAIAKQIAKPKGTDCRFRQDSQACSKASYPVAVSLPQLSEGAMGQLVDNFFYCNFEIDSFRKHVAFGISHHFYHQKLSFLCSYVGGDVPVDQVPTLTEQDLVEIRQLKSVEKGWGRITRSPTTRRYCGCQTRIQEAIHGE